MATMQAKRKSYPLIPEEEGKCIWMMTGLISYKLCDRSYQCESCPFDQAIKNEEKGEGDFQEAEADWGEGAHDGEPSSWVGGNVFYHPDHCWVKVENHEKVRIGVNDLLAQLLAPLKVVILPQAGSFTGRGECCAHIIQEDYILPVISPLSGFIQTVNPRLQKEPELITADPQGDGWLLTMKPDNLEEDLKNLLFGRKAFSWHRRKEKEIIARADDFLRQNPQAVGPTMQDGGVMIGRLQDILHFVNPQQRAQILDFSIAGRQDLHLREPDRMQSEFIATAVHELRAPVAAVEQQLTVILNNMAGELNEKQGQLIARAKERTKGILLLIRDLLDISKLEAGKMAREREQLSLAEVIADVVEMLKAEAEQKNIRIEFKPPQGISLIHADRGGMESIFTNLLANAIKYTAAGSVTITLGEADGLVKVVVADTGIGIKSEDLPRIFDKFYRVKSPETRQIVGTGLGLAIVKNIVDSHRGSVTVESRKGKGTTFSVFLPKIAPPATS